MLQVMFVIFVLFVAAQGAAVFGTAYLASKRFGWTGWLTKIGLMAASYVAWISFTIMGYSALGGDGGLMDGFGMVISLCFFALVSSTIYTLIWLTYPIFRERRLVH